MLANFSSPTCALSYVHDFTNNGIYRVRNFEKTINEALKILMDGFSGTLIFFFLHISLSMLVCLEFGLSKSNNEHIKFALLMTIKIPFIS